ncbi:MAG: phosphoribosylformylglycinamidine cyclo-ligase [Thermoplasmata archaeon]|nr:phosphoribosylformylglycinamidine cyclo-ligase [Thermoplasmata archaeon]
MPRARGGTGWTYARAGVDRGATAIALRALLSAARPGAAPRYGRPVRLPGHYAGLVAVGRETLALTTDTVGTKVLLAEALGRWSEVGEDLVAINVNDLAAVGARPIGLVDCISCPSPDPSVFRQVGQGIRRGLTHAGCALLGGETAVVPAIVRGVDLGGTALGHFPLRRRPITGARIRVGDELLGLRSSGFHANGFTLIRRLLEEARVDLRRPRPGQRTGVGRELLRPTRTYTEIIEGIADHPAVHGLAHISGGGVRNLLRLNDEVQFELDRWPEVGGLEAWLASLGDLPPRELYQTFNMGIGFVVVVDRGRVTDVLRRLRHAGAPDARRIGTVVRGTGVSLPGPDLQYDDYGGAR